MKHGEIFKVHTVGSKVRIEIGNVSISGIVVGFWDKGLWIDNGERTTFINWDVIKIMAVIEPGPNFPPQVKKEGEVV